MTAPVEVTVVPGESSGPFRHTLRALERACHVRFVAEAVRGPNRPELFLDPNGGPPPSSPGTRRYVVLPGRRDRSRSDTIAFTNEKLLDPRLRSRVVRDGGAVDAAMLVSEPGDLVLARRGSEPIWISRSGDDGASTDLVSVPPPRLAEAEALRSYLKPGCFVGLLPLVHFLRSLATRPRRKPPLRACFVLDDPNLKRPTYGALDYEELAASARARGYHVAMATIPLDTWWMSRRVGRTFRDNLRHLSLCMHGNDHTPGELANPVTLEESVASLAQGRRRMDRFQRQLGLVPDPIVVPPHDPRFSDTWMRGCGLVGLDAGVIDLVAYLEADGTAFPDQTGFELAAFGAGNFPLINRFPVEYAREASVLAAFLDQPIIIGGHHQDASDQLRVIEELADHVDSFGDIQWMSLGDIALSNYESRLEGDRLTVRMFSRRNRVEMPDQVDHLIVELGGGSSTADGEQHVIIDGEIVPMPEGESPAITTAGRTVEVIRGDHTSLDYRGVPGPRVRTWPAVRRTLTEARDRSGLWRL